MSTILPFIVAGLTAGAIYGLAAVGLVLTYKTSGVFNFAQGALATIGAYAFYSLYVEHGLSWPLAAAICVLVVGPIMGLLLELMARAIGGVSLALKVAATIGLLLVIEAGIELLYGVTNARAVPVFLPHGNVRVFSTNVAWSDIVTIIFAIVVTAALSLFFRHTRRGLAMRAVVSDPALLDSAGTSPVATRRLAWILGCMLAAASGVLLAPVLQLDPVQLTFLVVAAFGAAAIGAFTSLPLTFMGGLLIGVAASLSTKYLTTGLLSGMPPSMPFLVLFAVLLAFPKRYLRSTTAVVPLSRSSWRAPLGLQVLGSGALLVFLLFVPSFAGLHIIAWTTALATTVTFLSLGLLVRTSGQVSLAQVSFTAIGVAAFSHLTVGSGVPWLLALLLAGLIAVPVGALLAVPAVRLGGLYLALATFGFGILLQFMFYTQGYMFGDTGAGLQVPRPHISGITLDSDKGYYYVVLAVVVVVSAALVLLDRSRLGRLLRGMGDSPVALETSGASTRVTQVLVFCTSAFLAAISGALVGAAQTTVSADAYQPLLSLTYFALIVIAVGREPWYALIAAFALILVPSYLTGDQVSTWLQLLFGATAILFAVTPASRRQLPAGVLQAIDSAFEWFRLPALRRRGGAPAPAAVSPAKVTPGALAIEALQVRFGGLVAVDGVSIEAPTGRITGLIGPNGAGKTTTFNACTGLVSPSRGRVVMDGNEISGKAPSTRARAGLGRTFQKMELFDSLSVRENVAVGAEGSMAGAQPLSHVIARPGDRNVIAAATDHALELCELVDLAETPAGSLSTGQRRLVELARCIAGPYRVLLLDEPSSGLDHGETAKFGAILRKVVEERDVGILLVEHDMSLVLDICETIYVLDFGKLVFTGTPDEIVSSPLVQAAYLGDATIEEAAPPPTTEPASQAVGP